MTFGYWIPIWISRYWPLVVGGKALASWIPYTIISFELMVLIGGLSTVAGLFIARRLPKIIADRRVRPAVQRWTTTACGSSVLPEQAQEVDRLRCGVAGAVEVRNAQ